MAEAPFDGERMADVLGAYLDADGLEVRAIPNGGWRMAGGARHQGRRRRRPRAVVTLRARHAGAGRARAGGLRQRGEDRRALAPSPARRGSLPGGRAEDPGAPPRPAGSARGGRARARALPRTSLAGGHRADAIGAAPPVPGGGLQRGRVSHRGCLAAGGPGSGRMAAPGAARGHRGGALSLASAAAARRGDPARERRPADSRRWTSASAGLGLARAPARSPSSPAATSKRRRRPPPPSGRPRGG